MWDVVAMWLVALVVILLAATLRARSLRIVNPVPRPRQIDVAVPKPPPRRAAENNHPRQQRRRAIIERPLPELEPIAPPPVPQVRSRSLSQEGRLPIQNAPLVGRGKLKDIYAYGAYDPVAVLPSGTTSPREPSDDDEDEEQGFFSAQSAANNELRQIGDWNQRFQNAIQTIRGTSSNRPLRANALGFSINTPLNERIEVNRDLIHLAQDFIYSSSTYGKIVRFVLYLFK